jgi:hypothetical protein
MPRKQPPLPAQRLDEVKEQFKAWRKTRKSLRPIPEQLWSAAVDLTAHHSISQISKQLVVDYSALKRRVQLKKKDSAALTSSPDFIELNLKPPAAASECMVEMQNRQGSRLRMHFRGQPGVDLLQLAKLFWTKGA